MTADKTTERGCDLGDVGDLRAFCDWQVKVTFRRYKRPLMAHEYREAQDAAFSIAYDIWEIWNPERCPRFSALLLSLMGNRLLRWHERELRQSGRGSFNHAAGTAVYRSRKSLDAAEAVAFYDAA